jgi:hypothetical protein
MPRDFFCCSSVCFVVLVLVLYLVFHLTVCTLSLLTPPAHVCVCLCAPGPPARLRAMWVGAGVGGRVPCAHARRAAHVGRLMDVGHIADVGRMADVGHVADVGCVTGGRGCGWAGTLAHVCAGGWTSTGGNLWKCERCKSE